MLGPEHGVLPFNLRAGGCDDTFRVASVEASICRSAISTFSSDIARAVSRDDEVPLSMQSGLAAFRPKPKPLKAAGGDAGSRYVRITDSLDGVASGKRDERESSHCPASFA